ncbi:unnamed protein product [Didymodactylos carnosus]|uniref:U3 small nucleolar RNA-associated protein 25 homolog n=1 Tax=Didymodactylos carnosus TaxID=1234261 RepID=A0A813PIC4_9BILA|nr:unnamed protein product [Didymodactylos carnosus]CAF0754584.1 unnamed protein product [Didymodactylos carnosus]CAF3511598.1 unnamed protein product [Didymodactylos carnosus]CAF3534773.1 unnamed protein product [Didymodactylos carnosus]
MEISINDTKSDPFLEHFETLLDESYVENNLQKKNKSKLIKEHTYLDLGQFEYLTSYQKTEQDFSSSSIYHIESYSIKKSLLKNIYNSGRTLTNLQLEYFNLIQQYNDVYYPNRTIDNGEQFRFITCLHLLNHIKKSRQRILQHNQRLKDNPELEYQDQGYSRTKILIIVPFRESVRRIVQCFEDILIGEDDDEKNKIQLTHRKRFKNDYGTGDEQTTTRTKPKFQRSSDEYDEIFSGNTDDHFRLGLCVTRKSLKFYTKAYQSDILIVSPVGLRTMLEKRRGKKRKRDDENEDETEDDIDNATAFLSSIECVFCDQLDVLYMQNFDHLLYIFENLNIQPKKPTSIDFSRIRAWTLNNWSKYYRQIIVLSSFTSPFFLNLFHRFSTNYQGQCIFKPKFPLNGYICQQTLTNAPQLFQRIQLNTMITDKTIPEQRWQYFIDTVLPRYDTMMYDHTLIYLSSYFDFVRLRNYMKDEKHRQFNFATLSEYSTKKEILLNRNMFFHRQIRFLLITERFHFYYRYRIRGCKHILFYELPSYGQFYNEIAHFLTLSTTSKNKIDYAATTTPTCTTLYTKQDALKLAYVLGQKRTTELLNSDKNVHMFSNKVS